ncbi:MAG: rhodanese-like domain-containing protein [Pseudomonadota bacterium]
MRNPAFEAFTIVAVASILAFGSNYLRRDGIALIETDWTAKMAAKKETAGLPVLSLKEALAAFKRQGTVFIDARSPGFYRMEHIAGAISVPQSKFDEVFPRMRQRLPADDRIIVYCSGAACEDSTKIAQRMIFEGFDQVRIFTGGMDEWKKAGLPVEQEGEPMRSAERGMRNDKK